MPSHCQYHCCSIKQDCWICRQKASLCQRIVCARLESCLVLVEQQHSDILSKFKGIWIVDYSAVHTAANIPLELLWIAWCLIKSRENIKDFLLCGLQSPDSQQHEPQNMLRSRYSFYMCMKCGLLRCLYMGKTNEKMCFWRLLFVCIILDLNTMNNFFFCINSVKKYKTM